MCNLMLKLGFEIALPSPVGDMMEVSGFAVSDKREPGVVVKSPPDSSCAFALDCERVSAFASIFCFFASLATLVWFGECQRTVLLHQPLLSSAFSQRLIVFDFYASHFSWQTTGISKHETVLTRTRK